MSLPEPIPGPIALVTGASSGIGEAFARELAARGYDLVVVARRRDRLEALAAELRASRTVSVHVIACDISDCDARQRAYSEIAALGRPVELLVNCAGYGLSGAFYRQDPAVVTSMVRTNLEASTEFTATYLPGMVQRNRGGVLFVSSVAGMYPNPGMAAYAATKAAMLSLAEALHGELARSDVRVAALCPPAVDTDFSRIAGVEEAINAQPSFMVQSPAACAKAGLDGLEARQRVIVPGRVSHVLAWLSAHLPRNVLAPFWRKTFQV
jgi:short-subunit dehydrogenase